MLYSEFSIWGAYSAPHIYAAAGKSGACKEFYVFWTRHMMIVHCYDHTTREY